MTTPQLHVTLHAAVARLQVIVDQDTRERGSIGWDLPASARILSDYLQLYEDLEECYHNTVRVQLRVHIRQVLLRVTTRIYELYVQLTRPVVLQPDQQAREWEEIAVRILENRGVIDLEIPIPRLVKDDQGEAFRMREEMIDHKAKALVQARVMEDATKPPDMQAEDAALLLQRAERARQSRRETVIRRIIQTEQMALSRRRARQNELDMSREGCAEVIKEFWLTYSRRRTAGEQRKREMELVGYVESEAAVAEGRRLRELVTANIARRGELRIQRAKELEEGKGMQAAWLGNNRQVELERKLEQLAAEFYSETKATTRRAPRIRPRTKVLETITAKCEEPPDPELPDVLKRMAEKGRRKKKEPEVKPAARSGGARKKDEVPVPESIEEINKATAEFLGQWGDATATDEYDVLLLRREVWTAMLPDIAVKCEAELRNELKNLKILEMRRVRKAKVKKPRKKRARKSRDPLRDKTNEELVEELMKIGIVERCPAETLEDFAGHFNHAMPVRYDRPDPDPRAISYAAIRAQVVLDGMLPFAVDREKIKDIPRGVLIAGNKGTGKSLLARAIANGMGAAFINFSPAVLVGKVTPKPRMLMLMVMRIAKALAPSVICCDDIDRMFGRGKKKSDSSKKFKGQLRRQLRKVKARDRVLFIATTTQQLGRVAMRLFNRCIEVPVPNFPTRLTIWQFWLKKCGLVAPGVDADALAFASEGYTAASIARCCGQAVRVRDGRADPREPVTGAVILDFLGEAPEDESKPPAMFKYAGFRPKAVAAKKG